MDDDGSARPPHDRLRQRRGGSPLVRRLGAVIVLVLVAAACGGDGSGSTAASPSETGAQGGDANDPPGKDVIRFAFSPDPVWDYLRDTGMLAEWEERHNLRIHTSESWDEYTYFAAGHGDIVSLGTYELPLLEQETGVKVVAFGQYNHLRAQFMRKAGDPYETIADVPRDATVCVLGATEIIADSVIADRMHGIDLRVGAGDFSNVVAQDLFVMPEMVARGECTVAASSADAAVNLLMSSEVEMMNDGRATWQLYQDMCQCQHKGVMSNLFVATEEWFDEHRDQAAAFLELWETGLRLWKDNKEEIVGLYPQHFAVEGEEQVEWMVDYVSGPSDWFADTVYMDEAWIADETKIYDHMVEAGLMDAGAERPRFEPMQPAS